MTDIPLFKNVWRYECFILKLFKNVMLKSPFWWQACWHDVLTSATNGLSADIGGQMERGTEGSGQKSWWTK